MVEAIADGIQDELIENLRFKLPPTAKHITERKSVTFHASGSNEYSAANGGTKLIKIGVNGDGWLDPSTVRIAFDVYNTNALSGALLRPVSGGHSFFRRLRILANGTIVEDISEFNRCQELFTILMNKNSKVNVDAESFGCPPYDYTTNEAVANFPGIAGQQSQTIIFTPLSGILSQNRWLPLRYVPLVFELELVSDNTLPFVLKTIGPFDSTNTSDSWNIQNVQIKADICTLDNTVQNDFTELLLSGKSLNINYCTYISQFQSILSGSGTGQQKVRINIARSLSRLKSIFVTLEKAQAGSAVYKDFNNFYSPMYTASDDAILGKANEIEFQVQVGPNMLPEYPIRSHGEAFYQLKKTLGIQSSALHSFDINAQQYRRNKFVLAIDTERVLSASFTGLNTRSGEMLNIRLDNTGTNSANYAHNMYVLLHADCVMEVNDGGIRILD